MSAAIYSPLPAHGAHGAPGADSARLDEAARHAVLRALFNPQLQDGRPGAVTVPTPLNFQLAS